MKSPPAMNVLAAQWQEQVHGCFPSLLGCVFCIWAIIYSKGKLQAAAKSRDTLNAPEKEIHISVEFYKLIKYLESQLGIHINWNKKHKTKFKRQIERALIGT